jgi:prephenate dehydrogenase
MEEPGFRTDTLHGLRVLIWGLGLMGGSLAMALRGKCSWLGGIDHSPEVVAQALKRDIIDAGSTQPNPVIDKADMIILATPVCSILRLIEEIPQKMTCPAIILDLGSTKREILRKMDNLPALFDPVGGHPMCGKEKGTLQFADPAIYHQAPFALVSLQRTSTRAKTIVEEMTRTIGSVPLWIDAQTHDRWVAATSHVPFMIANAYARSTPEEAIPLVGPGFRSTARLAASSPIMMVEILQTNSDNIRCMLAQFKEHLDHYEKLLEDKEFFTLAEEFQQGVEQYQRLVGDGK